MNEQTKIPSIQSFDIDHLGIVASVVDEIGLVQQIDRLLGTHDQQHLSSGQLVKAMILNGLGFVSAPLYLFQEFFEGKATEHLIAPGVKPEHLNDDKLGRVLDNLFDADLTKVFVSCAMKAASRYGIDPQRSSMHLDSTSFHLHGDYETGEPRDEDHPEAAISITHGYSRDGRPDLKQFIVDLIVSADGDVPLFCRIADGNEADKAVFARLIRDFRSQVDLDTLFVADSALYSADSLRRMGDLRWLTRVPLTLAEAKRVLSEIEEDAFEESTLSGYRIAEVSSAAYAGIPQRWLIVESEARREAARLQLDRRLAKTEKHLKKRLNKLNKEDFECEGDARHGAEGFAGELRHHDLTELRITRELRHEKPGRPAKDARAREVYKVQGTLSRNEVLISKTLRNSGRFILATNEVSTVAEQERNHANDELLRQYKGQQSAERGFRFLKDPLFFASSIFVKTPKRVASLAMVMGLCLLVYTLGQRALREALERSGTTMRHQTGKQTARPTLRWVFQVFQAVHLLKVGEEKRISNLSEERARIVSLLGPSARRYYLLL